MWSSYQSHSNFSSNEGDSGISGLSGLCISDWPIIVAESAFSESLPRLRVNAAWCLIESSMQVRIRLAATRQNCDGEMGTWSSKTPKAAYKSCLKSCCPPSSYKGPRDHNPSRQSAISNYSHRSAIEFRVC